MTRDAARDTLDRSLSKPSDPLLWMWLLLLLPADNDDVDEDDDEEEEEEECKCKYEIQVLDALLIELNELLEKANAANSNWKGM